MTEDDARDELAARWGASSLRSAAAAERSRLGAVLAETMEGPTQRAKRRAIRDEWARIAVLRHEIQERTTRDTDTPDTPGFYPDDLSEIEPI